MAKHKPSVIYGLRKLGTSLKNGFIQTLTNKDLLIVLYEKGSEEYERIEIDRKTARLLAKRINQCLDDTK